MSRIATARKLAKAIITDADRLPYADFGPFIATQDVGYPLALAIVKGWVTGVTDEAIGHLEDTLVSLTLKLAVPEITVTPIVTDEPVPVTIGSRVLYGLVDGGPDSRPVLIGETLTDHDGDTFKVTGTEIGTHTGSLYLVGHWVTVKDQQVDGRAISRGANSFPGVEWVTGPIN